MGFDHLGGDLAADGLVHAINLVTDLGAPLAVVFGVSLLGLLLASLRRFLP